MIYRCPKCGFTYNHGYKHGFSVETCLRCFFKEVLKKEKKNA